MGTSNTAMGTLITAKCAFNAATLRENPHHPALFSRLPHSPSPGEEGDKQGGRPKSHGLQGRRERRPGSARQPFSASRRESCRRNDAWVTRTVRGCWTEISSNHVAAWSTRAASGADGCFRRTPRSTSGRSGTLGTRRKYLTRPGSSSKSTLGIGATWAWFAARRRSRSTGSQGRSRRRR
jgi:hypothetical protein